MKAIDWLLVVAVLVFIFSGSPTVFGPSSAVVVYESAEYIPEPYVVGALADIESRIVDQHITTGNKETPEYLSNAIDAAKKNGLPALVILKGSTVNKVVDLPSDADGIRDAIR